MDVKIYPAVKKYPDPAGESPAFFPSRLTLCGFYQPDGKNSGAWNVKLFSARIGNDRDWGVLAGLYRDFLFVPGSTPLCKIN